MAPPGKMQSAKHRIRRAHPLRVILGRAAARLDHASADEIVSYQQRRLRALVRLAAACSPFYRAWFRESRLDPRSICTVEDLGRLPLLHRHHLAERSDEFRVYPRRMMWAARSSGTVGTPVTAYRTPGSSVFELAVLERQWGWFGLPRGARRAILRGHDFAADRPGTVTMEVPGGRQLLISSFHLTEGALPTVLAALREFRPHVVEGWPSSISLLAALLRDASERFPVDAVITSSEVITPAQRALMREMFAGPVVDHYGQAERVAMAGSCEAGGYHVFPDYGIVEFEPVPGRANRWEIVGTPLHNWGFPVFRYRTGDQVGPAPDGPCPCGRAFPLLGRIEGRVEEVFTAADGRRIPIPSLVLDNLTDVSEAQIVQHAPGHFEVRLVPMTTLDRAAIEAQVRRNVDRAFGAGQTLSIRFMERIPRTAGGKFKPALVLEGPAAPVIGERGL